MNILLLICIIMMLIFSISCISDDIQKPTNHVETNPVYPIKETISSDKRETEHSRVFDSIEALEESLHDASQSTDNYNQQNVRYTLGILLTQKADQEKRLKGLKLLSELSQEGNKLSSLYLLTYYSYFKSLFNDELIIPGKNELIGEVSEMKFYDDSFILVRSNEADSKYLSIRKAFIIETYIDSMFPCNVFIFDFRDINPYGEILFSNVGQTMSTDELKALLLKASYIIVYYDENIDPEYIKAVICAISKELPAPEKKYFSTSDLKKLINMRAEVRKIKTHTRSNKDGTKDYYYYIADQIKKVNAKTPPFVPEENVGIFSDICKELKCCPPGSHPRN